MMAPILSKLCVDGCKALRERLQKIATTDGLI